MNVKIESSLSADLGWAIYDFDVGGVRWEFIRAIPTSQKAAEDEAKDIKILHSSSTAVFGDCIVKLHVNDFDKLFPSAAAKCECGATKCGSKIHSHWCPAKSS